MTAWGGSANLRGEGACPTPAREDTRPTAAPSLRARATSSNRSRAATPPPSACRSRCTSSAPRPPPSRAASRRNSRRSTPTSYPLERRMTSSTTSSISPTARETSRLVAHHALAQCREQPVQPQTPRHCERLTPKRRCGFKKGSSRVPLHPKVSWKGSRGTLFSRNCLADWRQGRVIPSLRAKRSKLDRESHHVQARLLRFARNDGVFRLELTTHANRLKNYRNRSAGKNLTSVVAQASRLHSGGKQARSAPDNLVPAMQARRLRYKHAIPCVNIERCKPFRGNRVNACPFRTMTPRRTVDLELRPTRWCSARAGAPGCAS